MEKRPSKKILIVNYGMGNIGSVANALDYLGAAYIVSERAEDMIYADGFILPGVGAFAAAMENLRKLNLVDRLTEQVMVNKKPFLGICLGLQLMAYDSLEQGFSKGLGWINGHVLPLDPPGGLPVPHVGWNTLSFNKREPLFQRIDDEPSFYFDHSFYLRCDEDVVSATCDYGKKYAASIQKENLFATQFHPEKSQRNGLKLLRNFLNFVDSHA